MYGVTPIGRVWSPWREAEGTPIQPAFAREAEGEVEIFPEFREGLADLEGFERIWILYWFHRAGSVRLTVVPYRDRRPRGVFATRAPVRPNPLGLSCVRLLEMRRAEGILRVAGLDILDGTPVLDLKPYVPEFDAYPAARCGWYEDAAGGDTYADGRFHEG
ncbi:MAG: tRNA (N6-threonylcarbamoyladenosine(37)-N6)-methyltransferase TrmO [Acidobacteriota bacterium]